MDIIRPVELRLMPTPAPSQIIHNEETKLLAGQLDRLATTCVTVGIAGPVAASLYGIPTAVSVELFVLYAVVWLVTAVFLHHLARRVLKGLRST
jgi:hypothetical protein